MNLSSNPAADMFPSFAPSGGLIAFTSFRDGGNGEIYVMNADGSDQTRLTTSPGTDTQPTWSPDGQQIAFRTDRDGDWEIYVMNADGSGQTNVSDTARHRRCARLVPGRRPDPVRVRTATAIARSTG